MNRPLVAFVYDFDGTLAPGNMQDHVFIPNELGEERSAFWSEVKSLAKSQEVNEIHAYMYLMLRKAKARDLDLSKSRWLERGRELPLYEGVEGWFNRQNERAAYLEVDLRHFIVSSGNREMIQGSSIADEFEKIYASAFIFNEHEQAEGTGLGVDYTSKTQYLFRINKWTLDEWDDTSINRPQPLDQRPVPFNRMVFFGDGLTDVPSMRLVTDQGGYSVAVYDQQSERSRAAAKQLREDGRAKYAGPTDYKEGSPLDLMIMGILTELSVRFHAENLVQWPE